MTTYRLNVLAALFASAASLAPAPSPTPTPTPPSPSPSPASSMALGINTGWLRTWAGAIQFANLVVNAGVWSPVSTTATSYSQDMGVLTTVGGSSTDVWRSYISDQGLGLPSGTYTILNPSGLNVGIGPFGGPSFAAYSTATQRTFNYTQSSTGMYLFVQGADVSNAGGNLALILPGCLESWQGGNPWNPQYLAYMAALAPKQVRFMDALNANETVEVDWADRCPSSAMIYNRPTCGAGGHNIIPWELIIDFANRTGIAPWVNVPARASTAYMASLAALFQSTLSPSIRPKIEYANETWNTASAFSDHNTWVTYRPFTKYTAAANSGSDTMVLAGHGLSSGDGVVGFVTKEGNAHGVTNSGVDWKLTGGVSANVTVIDANTFQVRDFNAMFTGSIASNVLTVTAKTAGSMIYDGTRTLCGIDNPISSGRKVLSQLSGTAGGVGTYSVDTGPDVAAGNLCLAIRVIPARTNYLYCKQVESGKTASNDINSSLGCLDIWDAFDAAYGTATKPWYVVGSMAAGPSKTQARFSVSGISTRADSAAVAPYFNGLWWVGNADSAAGTITPKVWTAYAKTVFCALYLASDTPTNAQIAAGTGAIGTQSIVTTGNGNGNYVAGTAFSGLTDGTAYKLHFVVSDANYSKTAALKWIISGPVTSGAGVTNAVINDTYDNQAQRAKYSSLNNASGILNARAYTGTKPISVYECGFDYSVGSSFGTAYADQNAFTAGFLASTQAADALRHHFYTLAAYGAESANQYGDMLGSGVFSLTPTGYTDTTSPRFAALAAANGTFVDKGLMAAASNSLAPLMSPTLFPDLLLDDLIVAPTYPHTLATLPAGFTYTLLSGNDKGNFTLSGNALVMNNGNGVDFATPTVVTLLIEVSDSYSSYVFNAQFSEGSAWYANDALMAWDSTASTDNTAITPVSGHGSALAKTSTNPATIANGLWDMSSATVYQGSGLQASFSSGTPFMIATVVDKNTTGANLSTIVQVASGSMFVSFRYGPSGDPEYIAYMGAGAAINSSQFITMPAASFVSGQNHVHWAFFDAPNGQVTSGYDLNVNSVQSVTIPANGSSQTVTFGATAGTTTGVSKVKQGSIEVVARAGLVLGDSSTRNTVLELVQRMKTLHGIS